MEFSGGLKEIESLAAGELKVPGEQKSGGWERDGQPED